MGYGPLVLTLGRAALGLGLLVLAFGAEAQRFELDWAVRTGGPQLDGNNNVAIDAAGNIYDSGSFSGSVDFDPGPDEFVLTGTFTKNYYVRKLDSDGNFVYAVSWTVGAPALLVGGITVDALGNVYLVGSFMGTVDLDPGPGITELSCSGTSCAFVLRLDSIGQFSFVRSLSGSGTASMRDIILDASSNVFITGSFFGTVDFDPGPGVFELTSQGNGLVGGLPAQDTFVLKLDASGNFVSARAMGGNNSVTEGRRLAVDASGAVYVAGNFLGTVDFDPGAGVSSLESTGFLSGFLLKLDSSGNFVYAREHGGTGSDTMWGLAVTAAGSVFTVGYYRDTVDFEPGLGTATRSSVGDLDLFVEKRDAAGDFEFVISLGETGSDFARDCVLGPLDNLYVSGIFHDSVDFDPSPEVRILTSTGPRESAFLMVLDPMGNLLSAEALVGTDGTDGEIITLGAGGAVLISGQFSGTTDFDPGPGVFELTSAGSSDAYLVSLVPNRRILSLPQSGTVEEGTRVELRGPIGVNYQWTKDGTNVIDDPPRVTGANTSKLVLDPAELDDSGVYRVGYDNGAKAIVTSDPFVLTVVPFGALPVGGVWWIAAAVGLVTASVFIRRIWSRGV